MRFSYLETMCDISQYPKLAVAVEQAGFNAFTLPDSVIYPRDSITPYPYLNSGKREFIADRPVLDPFVLAAHLAGFTQSLKFVTFVAKLPIRDPVLTAKTVSSLAAITENRFLFGVGLSPWPEDYLACGQAWDARGRRMNEMLAIFHGLLQGDYFAYAGEFYQLDAIKICPVPTKKVPVLIGGHSVAAMTRAALYGDGWMHAGGDKDELSELLPRLQKIRETLGVAHKPFEIHVISTEAYTTDGIERLQDLGVTDVIVGFRDLYDPAVLDNSVEEKIGAINGYADTVINKLGAIEVEGARRYPS